MAGNLIGTNGAGTASLGNGDDGVLIEAVPRTTRSAAPPSRPATYSGNASSAWRSRVGATANVVAGNFIGTDKNGSMAIGNATGVEIDTSATGNTIGGVTSTPGTGPGNVISGNTGKGVVIDGTGVPAETPLYLKADGNTEQLRHRPATVPSATPHCRGRRDLWHGRHRRGLSVQ